MAFQHHLRMLCLITVVSVACAPTAPSPYVPPPPAPLPTPTPGVAASALAFDTLSIRTADAPGGGAYHEPWFVLRETTGTDAANLEAIAITLDGGDSWVFRANCFGGRIAPGAIWTPEDIGLQCRQVLTSSPTSFTVGVTFRDDAGRRKGVVGAWPDAEAP